MSPRQTLQTREKTKNKNDTFEKLNQKKRKVICAFFILCRSNPVVMCFSENTYAYWLCWSKVLCALQKPRGLLCCRRRGMFSPLCFLKTAKNNKFQGYNKRCIRFYYPTQCFFVCILLFYVKDKNSVLFDDLYLKDCFFHIQDL